MRVALVALLIGWSATPAAAENDRVSAAAAVERWCENFTLANTQVLVLPQFEISEAVPIEAHTKAASDAYVQLFGLNEFSAKSGGPRPLVVARIGGAVRAPRSSNSRCLGGGIPGGMMASKPYWRACQMACRATDCSPSTSGLLISIS
jgi:hypothetical protein